NMGRKAPPIAVDADQPAEAASVRGHKPGSNRPAERMMRSFLGCLAAILAMTNAALALTPAEQRGKNFVVTNCARCHAVDKVSPSPLTIAPPFRDLHRKYPIESLQESLAEGISTGH